MTAPQVSVVSDGSSLNANPPLSQRSLEKLVDLILDTTDPADQVRFYGLVLSGHSHVQHRQALALARAGRVTPEAARLWLTGGTGCSCAGRLYLYARLRFDCELEMIRAFGDYINRDLIGEVVS